jgi:hypothetical protein
VQVLRGVVVSDDLGNSRPFVALGWNETREMRGLATHEVHCRELRAWTPGRSYTFHMEHSMPLIPHEK